MANDKPKKTVTIVVEGTEHEWPKDDISYAEVVTLEVPDYAQHPEITYSVRYKRGQPLLIGQSVMRARCASIRARVSISSTSCS